VIITFVTLGFRPFRTSGFDISGERLVKALLEAGHSVRVIAGKHGEFAEEITHPNLHIHRLNVGRTDWIGFAYQSAKAVADLGSSDVVHYWDISFAYTYRGGYVASLHHSFRQRCTSLKGYFRRRPFRWIGQYLYYFCARYLLEIPASRRARGLLAVSETSQNEYVQYYKLRAECIHLVRHGFDLGFFKPIEQDTLLQFRKRIGIAESDQVVLFSGFITPRKGLEYLAQAMVEISPLPKLLIIGKWRNEAYRREVYSYLAPIRDQVIETGFVPDEMMPAYYSLADVYVSPSLMEGFGLPLGEALACGTPVVAFNAGAVAEVVGPGGILVPPRDVKGLANAVSYLLQNPDIRHSMAEKGREHIAREFSVSKMLEATLEAYERFLGVKSNSGSNGG